jgi:flagellar P-ring protein precursor FlgI
MKLTTRVTLTALVLAFGALAAPAERIKDIVEVQGVRANPLWGYGLVIGLNGTGDNSEASKRAMTNILRRSGLVLEPSDLSSKNIASVLVTAELPPFGRKGSTIDVSVSCIGNATSLQGGMLLMAPLTGADGNVYAVAQGPISIGGFSAGGQSATITQNHTTVGDIPAGATVEKEEIAEFVDNGVITLQLRNPDFTTAQHIATAINAVHADSSVAEDAGTVRVKVPEKTSKSKLIGFMDSLGNLEVKVDFAAMVVINEKDGTIVVGENVGISSVAISHGNLSIVTQEKDFVSQPNPMSKGGTTEKVHRTEIEANEESGVLRVVKKQVSVHELAKALNAMGLTPRDLISIFKALRQAGALQAQLKII